MRHNNVIKTAALAIVIAASIPETSARERLNFNTDWGFHRGDITNAHLPETDDSGWIPAVIPHVMQLEKKHCGGNTIYDGIGWYRRYFTVGKEAEGKRVTVNFEGVMTNCEVYLNGEKITTHHGGYLGFSADLTDKVKIGDRNLLAVKVDASHDPLTPPGKPQEDMDFYYYSGIYRDVEMEITDRIYITNPLEEDIEAGGGVFITYPEAGVDKATVHVTTHIRSLLDSPRDVRIENILSDRAGNVVATERTSLTIEGGGNKSVAQTLHVPTPELWSPGHPYLYDLTTRILEGDREIDRINTAAGIRTISFDTESGFHINGESLYLRGANRHQAFPYIGDAAPNSMQERDAKGIRNGGFNAVRAAHYPNDPAFLDACDREGLLVVECIPGWQYFNSDPTFSERVCEMGKQMIRRDRNHPSVILWETALNETRYPQALADTLHRIAHREYPGDQMYTSGDYFGHEDMAEYFDVLYKQVGAFPEDGNVMTNTPENLVAVKPLLTREWGDGVGDKPRVSMKEPYREHLRQCYSRLGQLEGDGYFDWCMLDANPHMSGHFLWSYNDYTRGSQDETMYSGAVDLSRYPKPSYYMMQSMMPAQESTPMVYIATDNSSERDSCITVFSNADKVTLYRNGKNMGTIQRKDAAKEYPNICSKGGSPAFRFHTGEYEAGELKGVAYLGDREAVIHTVSTPGEACRLEIRVATEGIEPTADGSDLIPVYVVARDEKGNRVETFDTPVTLTVNGDAQVVGSGIERLGINPQLPEGGMAFYFIRAGHESGEIEISASASGIAGDTAAVWVKPYEGRYVAGAEHAAYRGNEEDGVVIKESTWQQRMLGKTGLKIAGIEGKGREIANIADGNDDSWWIAESNELPQTVTLDLGKLSWVEAARIRFQKDSSSYGHIIETSCDGKSWSELTSRECTGWDFKPIPVGRDIRYLRLTVTSVSEGRAGVSEITLY